MIVNLSSLPQHITLAVGERIVLPLPSYANSGNTWSASCLRGHGAAQVLVELSEVSVMEDSRGDGVAEPPPLMLALEQAVVSGLADGDAVWQLVLSRSFGSEQPTLLHDLRVTVKAH
jgi:hypothetical protein